MNEFVKIKCAKIILHVKLPTFGAAILKDFTYQWIIGETVLVSGHFYRATAMLSAVYAVVVCLCVCVCLSVCHTPVLYQNG